MSMDKVFLISCGQHFELSDVFHFQQADSPARCEGVIS